MAVWIDRGGRAPSCFMMALHFSQLRERASGSDGSCASSEAMPASPVARIAEHQPVAWGFDFVAVLRMKLASTRGRYACVAPPGILPVDRLMKWIPPQALQTTVS